MAISGRSVERSDTTGIEPTERAGAKGATAARWKREQANGRSPQPAFAIHSRREPNSAIALRGMLDRPWSARLASRGNLGLRARAISPLVTRRFRATQPRLSSLPPAGSRLEGQFWRDMPVRSRVKMRPPARAQSFHLTYIAQQCIMRP